MAGIRAIVYGTVRTNAGNAIQNAKVFVYEHSTTTPTPDLFTAESGGSAQGFLTSNSSGVVSGYITSPRRVDLFITDNSGAAVNVVTTLAITFTSYTIVFDADVQPAEVDQTDETQVIGGTKIFSVRPQLSAPAGMKLNGDITVATIAARTALTGMVTGDYCWVTDIDRVYRYNGSAWKPLDLGDKTWVTDYGVVADATDQTAKIHTCIDAVRASNGKLSNVIFFPSATHSGTQEYMCNLDLANVVSGRPGIELRGSGIGIGYAFGTPPMAFLTAFDPNLPCLRGTDTTGVGGSGPFALTNLAVYGFNAPAFKMQNGNMWRITNCSFRCDASGVAAVELNGCFWFFFERCTFQGPANFCSLWIRGTNASDLGYCYLMDFIHCEFNISAVRFEFSNASGGGEPHHFKFRLVSYENGHGSFIQFKNTSGTFRRHGDVILEHVEIVDPAATGCALLEALDAYSEVVATVINCIPDTGQPVAYQPTGVTGILYIFLHVQGLNVGGGHPPVICHDGVVPRAEWRRESFAGWDLATDGPAGTNTNTDTAASDSLLRFIRSGQQHASALINELGDFHHGPGGAAGGVDVTFRRGGVGFYECPQLVKAGVPADSDYLTAPRNGTLAVNSSTPQIYARIAGTWTAI